MGLLPLLLLSLMLGTAVLAGPAGCAATNLSRDANGVQYHSTKDISIGRAEWREWYQDGKPKSEFILDNGGGNASQVNAVNWAGAQQISQMAFQLGGMAARTALGLPPLPATPVAPTSETMLTQAAPQALPPPAPAITTPSPRSTAPAPPMATPALAPAPPAKPPDG